jgi:aminoglycoside phosphotransferase (APT) family kinase protein
MPYLILEDLSRALWPPPWDDAGVAAVLATLEDVAVTPPPEHVPEVLGTAYGASFRSGWDAVVADPEPLLRLGASSRYWLDAHVETLRAAAHAAPVEGDALLHMDVRSDNLCLRGGRAILVDWNLAARGNPLLDVAFWLPALALESGKPPHEVAPATAPFAACVAAFFACRAGLPPPPTAPTVREFQLAQLGVALPWAARVLDLPPPV